MQASAEKIPQATTEVARLAEQQTAQATRLKASLAATRRLLSAQEIDDGQAAEIAQGSQTPLEHVAVHRGEVIQLSITPRGNHGADSTLVEFEIVELGGAAAPLERGGFARQFALGNPHSRHASATPRRGAFSMRTMLPAFLAESLPSIDGRTELRGWRSGDTPSVFVNASREPVKVWTTLPPRQFFMHPGPQGAVALPGSVPVDGAIAIRGRVADAHHGRRWHRLASRAFCRRWTLADAFLELGETSRQLDAARRLRDTLADRDRQIPRGFAVAEGEPKNARIHRRGEPKDLGDEVPRKFPDFLGGQQVTATNASGRSELAGWLTDPSNPLDGARHGQSPLAVAFWPRPGQDAERFWLARRAPTHPELLDYLASRIHARAAGASRRSASTDHRSAPPIGKRRPAAPDDFYVGFARRRLTAEELRDTLLVASGELDRTPGEAHPFPAESTWSFTQHGPFAAEYDTLKRSVYVMQKRNRRARFFALFDGADPNASTPLRDVTTVPTQALFFLNDPFLHERAAKFAARRSSRPRMIRRASISPTGSFSVVRRRPRNEPTRQPSWATTHSFRRQRPTAMRREDDRQRNAAWTALARVLFASNEFLHID